MIKKCQSQEYLTPLLNNPSFAPLMQSNLTDLPSTLVITCEFDILRDEGVIYAQRLMNSGVCKSSWASSLFAIQKGIITGANEVDPSWAWLPRNALHTLQIGCCSGNFGNINFLNGYYVFSASGWKYQELDNEVTPWSKVKKVHNFELVKVLDKLLTQFSYGRA